MHTSFPLVVEFQICLQTWYPQTLTFWYLTSAILSCVMIQKLWLYGLNSLYLIFHPPPHHSWIFIPMKIYPTKFCVHEICAFTVPAHLRKEYFPRLSFPLSPFYMYMYHLFRCKYLSPSLSPSSSSLSTLKMDSLISGCTNSCWRTEFM